MEYIQQNNVIDTILNFHKPDLGKDYEQYRNHVYRVYNFAILFDNELQHSLVLLIAVAFHDLGIWTNKTFDYLEPSIALAKNYSLSNYNLGFDSVAEIEIIIDNHHKLTRINGSKTAEVFRQADLLDLTLGLIRHGIELREIKKIKKLFPNRGFHYKLMKLFCVNFIKNPFNPLPMYRF